MGIFFEAKFYVFALLLLYYPIKYKKKNFEQNLIFIPILQYFYYFIFTILSYQFIVMLFLIIYSIIMEIKLLVLLYLGEN